MFALIDLSFGALVDIAMRRFVTAVAAIDLLIADALVCNALTIFASELSSGTCGRFGLALRLILVTAISAVVLSVAQIGLSNTFSIPTRKLFWRTGSERAVPVLITICVPSIFIEYMLRLAESAARMVSGGVGASHGAAGHQAGSEQ